MIGAPGPALTPSGLAARIILFLSLALLPIGGVAYVQTAKLNEESRARSELSLSALTEAAASGEREAILRAFGAAQALAAAIEADRDIAGACSQILSTFVESSETYSFSSVIGLNSEIECASNGVVGPLPDPGRIEGWVEEPRPRVTLNPYGPFTGESVLVVSEPLTQDGVFSGYLTLSVPSSLLAGSSQASLPGNVNLMTFNAQGDPLSARAEIERIYPRLPDTLGLQSLVGGPPHSFAATDHEGVRRIYVVTPLVPDMVYALSIWPEDSGRVAAFSPNRLAGTLPFLMWGASVVVAFLAVNRMVIRPIRQLGRRMRLFARSRLLPRASLTAGLPDELQEMEQDFLDMAHGILRDEAAQENALREKTILLREVHHRVKNNLQLISSIMNMQIRGSSSSETKAVVQGLQERVRSLATVHRSLYETENLGRLDAGALLSDLTGQIGQMSEGRAVSITDEIEPVEMLPDQVVPLSLLAAEAMTNALKHVEPDETGRSWVIMRFGTEGPERAKLEVLNSVKPRDGDAEDTAAAGLGHRLIRAFAMQLGANLHHGTEGNCYRLSMSFSVSRDYMEDAA